MSLEMCTKEIQKQLTHTKYFTVGIILWKGMAKMLNNGWLLKVRRLHLRKYGNMTIEPLICIIEI